MWTGVVGVLWPLCEARGSARRPLPPSHCLPVQAFLTDRSVSAWIPHANAVTAANYRSLLLPAAVCEWQQHGSGPGELSPASLPHMLLIHGSVCLPSSPPISLIMFKLQNSVLSVICSYSHLGLPAPPSQL